MLICNLAASFQLDLLTFNFDLWPLSLPWTLTSGLDLESWPLTYDLDLAVLPKVTIQKCQFLVNVYIARGGGARSLTCQVHLLKLPCDLWPLVDPWPWWMTLTSGEWPWPLTLTFDLGTQFELCFFDNDKCRSDTSYRILNFYIWPFMFDLWLTFDLGEWPWPLMHDLDPWPWNLTLAQNLNYLFTILKYVKLALDIRECK